jgi:pimeloyl-ACP methyl ester carboxylesterase
MPYAINDGVRIHYKVEGTGFPLVIQHGFTDSMETWYEVGYVDAVKGKRQLILVDARGHGQSDKPHSTSAYGKKVHVEDILAVLHDLKIDRADYWGFSMGARIGFAMAQYASHRARSMIPPRLTAKARPRHVSLMPYPLRHPRLLQHVPSSPGAQQLFDYTV